MSARILFAVAVAAGVLLAAVPACAEDDTNAPSSVPVPATPAISTSTSPTYSQVTCTSGDAVACNDALQLASDTRDQLAALLLLGPTWRFPVHIHILTPDDPLTAKINREAAAVFSQGNSLKIEAVLPVGDPTGREFIQRQYVTALLWEKFFAKTTSFDKHTKLDVVPVWLVEGLREWLNQDSEHNRENIVRRAVQDKTAPTLAEVTGWHEVSGDRLLGLWQRSFCFYLVDSLVQKGPRRDDFQEWLEGFAGVHGSPMKTQQHFPTEEAWQHELADATNRSRALVYTWSETEAELTADETITFAASKDAKVQTCSLDTAATLPRTPELLQAVQERIFILTELELRAHAGWQPVLEAYRTALTSLVKDNDPAKAQVLFQQAHKLRLVITAYHQKLLDYTNWFEVTRDTGETTHFKTYFTTGKEMEAIQADPAHPNPVRADLLQLESEL